MNAPELSRLAEVLIRLQRRGEPATLLAVCPNSSAVLEAAVQVAAEEHVPMLFAATLNQVDREGGYTGWTPETFVAELRLLASRLGCDAPLYPCLDHGGPWLKDAHRLKPLSYEQTLAEVKASLTACLRAGYSLLHLDPTVDPRLPAGQPVPIDQVVERTLELIRHCERERTRLQLPPVAYEVGTEEVHGGLADVDAFDRFLAGLRSGLEAAGLLAAWPCFIVGKVGTDLHTTTFDPSVARRLCERVAPLGSLIKGHYTDWVANPEAYPASGMGGANVGPEFTATELASLKELCAIEDDLARLESGRTTSRFLAALEAAVVESRRWEKWLLPEEASRGFGDLTSERRAWLVATGARYVWTDPQVRDARQILYENLRGRIPNPHQRVVDRIAANIRTYVEAFRIRRLRAALSH